ncbi:MAG: hypothetical protein ACJ8F4_08000 [Sphingomonas sp.]
MRRPIRMDDGALGSALDRADRAPPASRDEELRAKVREVVEELDELIRQAAA